MKLCLTLYNLLCKNIPKSCNIGRKSQTWFLGYLYLKNISFIMWIIFELFCKEKYFTWYFIFGLTQSKSKTIIKETKVKETEPSEVLGTKKSFPLSLPWSLLLIYNYIRLSFYNSTTEATIIFIHNFLQYHLNHSSSLTKPSPPLTMLFTRLVISSKIFNKYDFWSTSSIQPLILWQDVSLANKFPWVYLVQAPNLECLFRTYLFG